MPAARYWRLVGIETYAGSDMELSELHLYDASGRVDATATLTTIITIITIMMIIIFIIIYMVCLSQRKHPHTHYCTAENSPTTHPERERYL